MADNLISLPVIVTDAVPIVRPTHDQVTPPAGMPRILALSLLTNVISSITGS
ncbi:hypothetical protein MBAV_003665 [Candidatus Magnetobacterium bavaricum]|uniref:Uncharacterized protein n=1 Tax=Candidatus Magnetobacterium bavaricum TaxID=29290 RepID=A0A0F3GQG5_9BACT|nr:hypothetical protein MBAV_003665 [Candidatus Magnetobacterium bavaricum]